MPTEISFDLYFSDCELRETSKDQVIDYICTRSSKILPNNYSKIFISEISMKKKAQRSNKLNLQFKKLS